MPETIIIKPSIAAQFQRFLQQERILFFSAPCGFGKTALVEALLDSMPGNSMDRYRIRRLNAGAADFAIPSAAEDWDILLIDDLQLLQEERDLQTLCELIRTGAERRFVLLSRGAPPGSLMAFQYAGLMTVLEAEDLLFDQNDIRVLLQNCGITATDNELAAIRQESIGYPLGVNIIVRYMSGGRPFSKEIVAKGYREVFSYFEAAVYRRFDLPMRHFLLELAPFEQFDLEMARMVSGDPHAGDLLDWLLHNTTMLRCDDLHTFSFWPQFRTFLLWQMGREYTDEKRKAIFGRGGLYYELKEDYAHALACYTKGGDHSKVSDLLVRNAELHPGMGHYSEMENYYRSLPESEIAASPSLMQGMSMLCALAMDYEGSERWYRELREFWKRCEKQDAAGKQARGRLAWLDISLPQRGVDGLAATIPAVFTLLINKELSISLGTNAPQLKYVGNGNVFGLIPFPTFAFIILILVLTVILRKKDFGRGVYAVGGDEGSAEMMGIHVNRTKIIVFTISGLMAACSGIILCGRLSAGQPTACEGWEMTIMAAVVLGGTSVRGGIGKIHGVFLGCLFVTFITNLINLNGHISAYWKDIITGVVLLIAVLVQVYSDKQKEKVKHSRKDGE